MTEDEKVDGPRIAAQILNRMPASHRELLLTKIAKADPHIAVQIQRNILSFDDIADLTNQSVQVLIKEVAHNDLVLSLKIAKEQVRVTLLTNMSDRKKQVVKEDFEALPPTRVSEVEEAQRRILVKLDELRTAGLVRSVGETSKD